MKLALFGSGEFTDSVNAIDEYLIKHYRLKNVAILPTAAGKEHDNQKWTEMAQSHFSTFDIKVTPVPILNTEDANNPTLVNLLDNTDWIFFSGGDPKYLFDSINETKLLVKIMQKLKEGALLAGSSAGAMVFGSYILANPVKAIFFKSEAVWQQSLGLVDYTVIPHFNEISSHKIILKRIIKNCPEKVKSSLAGIDENTALIIDDKGHTIKGIGNVYFNIQL